MILCIAGVLDAQQLARSRELLQSAPFVDGKATAGWAARPVKNNLQLAPGCAAHTEMTAVLSAVLARNEVLQAAALPRELRPPLIARYLAGMSYGSHVDDAIMGTPPMRTDLSYTLFLDAPEDCEGGELLLDDAGGEQSYKLEAGSLVLYPATSLHRVDEVTGGQRTVAVGWIQSLCPDPRHREALFDLYGLRKSSYERGGKSEEFDLLSKTYSNLLRQFSVL